MYKIATLLLVTFAFSSCFESLPVEKNEILKVVSNKSKSKKAILFLKGGNATSDNSLQVVVAENDYKLAEREVGNTFTVDSDHGSARQDINSIGFTWLSDDSLQIDYDRKLRVYIQKRRVNNVTIVYKLRHGYYGLVTRTDGEEPYRR